MNQRQIEVHPLTGGMGAEIHGVDLSREMDEHTFGVVHQTALDYGVIFFRGQKHHAGAANGLRAALGQRAPASAHALPGKDHPGIIEIIKKEDDTTVFGANWHTDQMFTPTPARYTILYAKQVPPVGGDTLFANLHQAYDALSDGMKAMIANLRTLSIYDKKKKRPGGDDAYRHRCRRPSPTSTHWCASIPETGRKALYLCHIGITRQIVGMSEEESRPLLTYLIQHATRPEFTCRFRWEVGSTGDVGQPPRAALSGQ